MHFTGQEMCGNCGLSCLLMRCPPTLHFIAIEVVLLPDDDLIIMWLRNDSEGLPLDLVLLN